MLTAVQRCSVQLNARKVTLNIPYSNTQLFRRQARGNSGTGGPPIAVKPPGT